MKISDMSDADFAKYSKEGRREIERFGVKADALGKRCKDVAARLAEWDNEFGHLIKK